jgi:predicted ATPase/DNA-binding SARP family transcriptional activator
VIAFLSMRLLGAYVVTLDHRAVESFATNKERALLAYIAVEARRPHHRDELAALLWPELPAEQARNNFRVTLHRLRKALDHPGVEVIRATRETVGFHPQVEVEVDACVLARQLEEVRQHDHRDRLCHECHALLAAAAELYQGAFLAGFTLDGSPAFDEWIRLEQEWLHLRVLDALEKLAAYHQRRGQIELAQKYAYRQIEMEPWRETAHRQLMHSLACAADYSAALAQFARCRDILSEELGVEPSAETVRLYEAILAARETHFPSLPAASDPLIGREEALSHIIDELADPACRLLTLVGQGGVGKSRLALEVARKLRAAFLHGVCYVPLSSVDSVEGLVDAIAHTAGYTFQDGRDRRAEILGYLANKEMLLVLDNFEQLVDELTPLPDLLARAPSLKLLVTSLVRLHLKDETALELQGLAVPEPGVQENIDQYGAVKLFIETARKTQPRFALPPETSASVLELCRFLSGMPLSIELAASWSRLLTPQEMLARLRLSLDFLESRASDAPLRQSSMRASFEYSWALLNHQEQGALMKLSIARGGFTVEAAQAITGASLPTLTALVDRSLVWQVLPAGRLDLHEMLRQFAGDKLDKAGESSAVHSSHSAYFLDLLCRLGQDAIGGDRQLIALQTLDADIDNIRAAWRWAIENPGYERLREATPLLALVLRYSGRVEQGERLFREAADTLNSRHDEDSKRLLGQVMARQAEFAASLLRFSEAVKLLEHSLATARCAGVRKEIAYCLGRLGDALLRQGDPHRARTVLEEALEIAYITGAQHTQIHALIALHDILILEGEQVQAIRLARQLLAVCRKTGDQYSLSNALYRLAVNSCYLGEYEAGKRYFEECLAIGRQLNDPSYYISTYQTALALFATRVDGAYDEAGALAERSLALARSINHPASVSMALLALADVACWQERYAEAVRRAEEGLQILAPGGDSEMMHFGRNVLSLALCGLGACEDARNEICQALQRTRFHTPKDLLLFHLAGMALVLTHEGDHERATELYALTASQHANPPAWLDKLPLHINARNALKTELPAEIFDRAWKLGEAGDLHEALRTVLSTYCV